MSFGSKRKYSTGKLPLPEELPNPGRRLESGLHEDSFLAAILSMRHIKSLWRVSQVLVVVSTGQAHCCCCCCCVVVVAAGAVIVFGAVKIPSGISSGGTGSEEKPRKICKPWGLERDGSVLHWVLTKQDCCGMETVLWDEAIMIDEGVVVKGCLFFDVFFCCLCVELLLYQTMSAFGHKPIEFDFRFGMILYYCFVVTNFIAPCLIFIGR